MSGAAALSKGADVVGFELEDARVDEESAARVDRKRHVRMQRRRCAGPCTDQYGPVALSGSATVIFESLSVTVRK